ncbi:hypothetical protein [Thioclava sp.]|uniref:hypothetical protein n=1 Tax=Thioclava sp. TaxID=1933450 RepID=UPI003AA996CD
MKVVILEESSLKMAVATQRLQFFGHEVSQTDKLPRATAEMGVNTPDFLIANLFPNAARGDAERAISVVLAGQLRSPGLVTVLVSDSALFSQGGDFLDAFLVALRAAPPGRGRRSDGDRDPFPRQRPHRLRTQPRYTRYLRQMSAQRSL